MDYNTFKAKKKSTSTPSGEIAYYETGKGETILFIHGLMTNSYLWRHQFTYFQSNYHCIALDLLAHGDTQVNIDGEVNFIAQAKMLDEFLTKLDLPKVHLVANDSGSGVALIFAAHHPDKLSSITITNGDVHDNWPPKDFSGFLDMVKEGGLQDRINSFIGNPNEFKSENGFAGAYEDPQAVTDETALAYIQPIYNRDTGVAELEKFILGFDCSQTVNVYNTLTKLAVPGLVVWGNNDPFFDSVWADWLIKNIPGFTQKVIVDGGKMLFVEERPEELNNALAQFLNTI